MTERKKTGLNRDLIKYVSMLTMFLNHFALSLLNPDTVLYHVFVNIGYFTAITMCYFLVEGYGYTHSKKKYAQRLLVFAIISEIPYVMALEYYQFNMMFTLLICLGIIALLDNKSKGGVRYVGVVALVFLSIFSDWALLAPIFTIMFKVWKDKKNKLVLAYVIAVLLFGYMNFANYSMTAESTGQALLQSFYSVLGILVSGVVILGFYNGKKSSRSTKFSKWFFYAFYPAHLALLAIIKMCI